MAGIRSLAEIPIGSGASRLWALLTLVVALLLYASLYVDFDGPRSKMPPC